MKAAEDFCDDFLEVSCGVPLSTEARKEAWVFFFPNFSRMPFPSLVSLGPLEPRLERCVGGEIVHDASRSKSRQMERMCCPILGTLRNGFFGLRLFFLARLLPRYINGAWARERLAVEISLWRDNGEESKRCSIFFHLTFIHALFLFFSLSFRDKKGSIRQCLSPGSFFLFLALCFTCDGGSSTHGIFTVN